MGKLPAGPHSTEGCEQSHAPVASAAKQLSTAVFSCARLVNGAGVPTVHSGDASAPLVEAVQLTGGPSDPEPPAMRRCADNHAFAQANMLDAETSTGVLHVLPDIG